MLLIEADSGRVLHAENATVPWYPASITKVMTAYVAFQAVKEGRLRLDSVLTVSERAAAQQPSKMGFDPGTEVTVENALKMMIVRSANDIAVVLAEGVSGSLEGFIGEMNEASRRLGMTQTSWTNPNGLPDPGQVSSARDLAILARAILREYPQYESYWRIPAIRYGKTLIRNHNSLIGRYDGADGMKTGFICSSGFNLVASATRNGRRLIAVMLGSQSAAVRGAKTAGLLERGFSSGTSPLSLFAPSLGTVDKLQPINMAPPDLREVICGKNRRRPPAEAADDHPTAAAIAGFDLPSTQSYRLSSLPPYNGKVSALLGPKVSVEQPHIVYAGRPRNAHEAIAAATSAVPLPRAPGRATAATSPQAGQMASVSPRSAMPATGQRAPGSLLSFAPPANAAVPPLTAIPGSVPETEAMPKVRMPMPRPRPGRAAARRR